MDDRARLTFVDVAWGLAIVAILGALWPIVAWSLDQNAGELSPGEGYLFQLALPGLIIVFLVVAWRWSISGAIQ